MIVYVVLVKNTQTTLNGRVVCIHSRSYFRL